MNPTQDLVAAEVTPARVLRDAATYVATYGWSQGGMFADEILPCPPACAVGAIRIAVLGGTQPFSDDDRDAGLSDLFVTTTDVLAMYLVNSGAVVADQDWSDETPYEIVAGWNDDSGRNACQVLGALNAASRDWDRSHTGGVQ